MKKKAVLLRMSTPELVLELEMEAKKRHMSRNQLIIGILSEWIKKTKHKDVAVLVESLNTPPAPRCRPVRVTSKWSIRQAEVNALASR